MFTEDEILKEFKRKIRRLYNFVTDSGTMNIEVEALTMLTTGKVGCVFPMVISSDFRTGQHRDDDHQEDAPYFKLQQKFP